MSEERPHYYWTWPELQDFLAEHGLAITKGTADDDEIALAGTWQRPPELFGIDHRR